DEKSSLDISTRRLLDNSIKFDENINRNHIRTSSSFNFDVDYTINNQHSFYVNYGISKSNNKSNSIFNSEQFSFEDLEMIYFTNSRVQDNQNVLLTSFGYRYDIDDKGMRLDLAGSYKRDNDTKNKSFLSIESNNNNSNIISNELDDV